MKKLLIALTLITPIAEANTWKYLADHDAGKIFTSSVKSVTVNTRRAWVKFTYSAPKLGVSTVIYLNYFDCAGEKYQFASSTGYSANGDVVFSTSTPTAAFIDVIPDSNADVTMKFVCQN